MERDLRAPAYLTMNALAVHVGSTQLFDPWCVFVSLCVCLSLSLSLCIYVAVLSCLTPGADRST